MLSFSVLCLASRARGISIIHAHFLARIISGEGANVVPGFASTLPAKNHMPISSISMKEIDVLSCKLQVMSESELGLKMVDLRR
jgi:hypothetical protein